MTFGPSVKRLLRRLVPQRMLLSIVLVFAIASVVLTVLAPNILGRATNLIFDGIVGRSLDPSLTKDQVVDGLRAAGDGTRADMVSSMDVVPGRGVD
ncbi:ABC transporter ATP-binding protein, partial [Acinetobacter baumannii]|nr:ABC transporter ATP-binding protein [Acinetobacter baumannii]